MPKTQLGQRPDAAHPYTVSIMFASSNPRPILLSRPLTEQQARAAVNNLTQVLEFLGARCEVREKEVHIYLHNGVKILRVYMDDANDRALRVRAAAQDGGSREALGLARRR